MNKKQITVMVEAYVKKKTAAEGTGHDWWHIDRVRKNALRIARSEGGDLFTIELAALLHDMDDWKFETKTNNVEKILKKLNVTSTVIRQVTRITKNISFKGGANTFKMQSIEGKIVQDADRLDATGAIGLARTFAYGGSISRPIHIPGIKILRHKNFRQYKKMRGITTINHIYEKILLLKNRMNTKTGKKLARQRHTFVEIYLKQFYKEWDGKI